MFKDREKLYQMYHTLLGMALTWAITIVINQYYCLKLPIAVGAVFSFLIASGIYLFDSNRKNSLRYVILGSFIPILALIFFICKINPLDFIMKILNWYVIYDGTMKLYHASYAYITILFITLIFDILLYLLLRKQIVKYIVAIFVFVALLMLSIKKVDTNKAVVGICLFYLLSIVLEVYGVIYGRKAKRQEKKEGILYLAQICLLISVLAVSMPSKPEPIQWTLFKNIYHNVTNQFSIWTTDFKYFVGKGEEEFSISISGYSDGNKNLKNANIKNDDRVALKISGSKGYKPVYLIGSVSDVYTGSGWKKSGKDFKSKEPEYLMDFLELTAALSRLDKDTLKENRFIDKRLFKLKYHNIMTKTFFYPLKSSGFDYLHGAKNPDTKTSNILFKKAAGNGTSYQYLFYDLNLQGNAFQKLLRDTDTYSYKKNQIVNKDNLNLVKNYQLMGDVLDKPLSDWNYDDILEERAQSIKKQYLVLPKSLPLRVRELSKKITENYDNDYDRLKAIEAFLQKYKYTTNPGVTPKKKDFVDYFLYDSKKGYCTSFATSMAVLGRCIGVPTRYVEGYVANFDQSDNTGMFLVSNNQAHAWAEAYLEGVGWIPFEATATYFDQRYTKWENGTKYKEYDANEYLNELNAAKQNEFVEKNQRDLKEAKKAGKNKTTGVLTSLIIILSASVVLFLLIIIYYQVLKMKYKKEFKKADYNQRMYLIFLRILSLLKKEGFELEPQETIRMFSLRVKDIYQYEKVTFPLVTEIFMKNRYGLHDITKEEFDKVYVFYQGIDRNRREKLSRLQVLFEEFLFLTKKSSR